MTQNATPHHAADAPEVSQVCIPNIGPGERKKRLQIGAGMLVVGVLLGIVLVIAGVHPLWRLTAFMPLWAGAISVWQVREKTCVALASRGVRNMDDGEAAVTDSEQLRQIGRQARRVRLEGLATAIVLTLVLVALP